MLNTFCNAPQKEQALVTDYLNHNDTVRYVGMQTCRSCHNDIYKTFIETGMGKSFDLATRAKSAANFSKQHVVYDKTTDMHYMPHWVKDDLYITEFRLNGKDTIHKRSEKVDYIIGSGQHTNSHMMNVNGYLYQLPLTWYAQKKKWDLPPGYENGNNSRFSRAIGFECMSCHNALPEFEEHSENRFLTVPQGIDCERCHGPGEVHVKEKLAGNIVDTATQIDYTIVNPKKLAWERQIDLCQRCHLQGNAVLKPGKSFRDFRPGMSLSSVVDIYMPKYTGKEDEFIMASHAQRLQMSKCFIQNKKGEQISTNITCITCHNPHVSVKVTGKQIFNNACMNCHTTAKQNTCIETPKNRALKQDNCWGCHMPKSGTIDIPHVTVTDHWIRIPAPKETKQKIATFAGIYCINNAQSDNYTRSNAYLNYVEKFKGEVNTLDSANTYLNKVSNSIPEIYFDETRIHLLYLKNDYQGIAAIAKKIKIEQIKNPWTCYRIGQAFQNMALFQNAQPWYEKASQIAPGNLDYMNKLATIYIELDKMNEGINLLQQSLQRNPKQSDALTNLGFAYIKQGDASQAIMYYNKALTLDPDFEQALMNKAGAYNMLGNRTEAKKLLQQIAKRNPDNMQVRLLLQQL